MASYQGQPVSKGYAVGRIVRLDHGIGTVGRLVQGPNHERAMFDAAVVIAKKELEELQQRAGRRDREIIMFQRVLLDDEELVNAVGDFIVSGSGSARAVEQASEQFARRLRQVDDSYIASRSSDVLDVCHRLVSILDNKPRTAVKLTEPSILVGDTLYPSDLFSVGSGMILGIATSQGSALSHSALIAQTLGIPAIVQLGEEFLEQADGRQAALDGNTGCLIIDPDETCIRSFLDAKQQQESRVKSYHRLKTAPSVTKDGTAFTMLANCNGPEDIENAIHCGAEGIGLVRTEFSLTEHGTPGEEEQFYFYTSCLAAAGGRPVTIRVYDVGADKFAERIGGNGGPNPALGLRGVRLLLQRTDIFIPQLCALLRAGARGPLRVMFPMVGSAEEFSQAMSVVEAAKENLRLRGVSFDENLAFGSMVEIPSAALTADEIAQAGARFFSIGTNDLAQYTCAADRLNPDVDRFLKPGGPAMDRLIRMTAEAGKKHDIPVCVCGLAAGNPEMAEHYLRLGVSGISVVAQSLMEVKEHLCGVSLSQP